MHRVEPSQQPQKTTPVAGLITGLLALLFVFIARTVALPPVQVTFVSGYGVVDNRRLLLTFAVLVLAVLLGPLLAGLFRRRIAAVPKVPKVPEVDPRPPARRSRSSVAFSTAIAALVFGALFVGPGVAYAPLDGHEVIHFGYLNEVDHGRLLNVDTRIIYGPLQGYSIYAFMRFFGFDLVGFRLYWNVLTALCLTLLFCFLFRRLNDRRLLVPAMLYIVLCTTAQYHLPDGRGINGGFWGWANVLRHGWVTLAALFLAGPLQRAAPATGRDRAPDAAGEPARGGFAWAPLVAGVVAALGGQYAQDTAPQGFVALGALVVLSRLNDPGRLIRRDLPLMFTGAAAGLMLVLLPAVVRGAVPEFIDATSRWPGLFMKGAGNLPFPSLLEGSLAARFGALPYFLVPALGLGFLYHNWTAFLRGVRIPPLEGALAIYTVLSTVSLLVRADASHLYNVTLAPIVLSFLTLDRVLRERRIGNGRGAILAGALCLPLVFLSPGILDLGKGLAGRILHPVPAPPAGWEKIPLERGGIWTPAGDWFNTPVFGGKDDPATVRMIETLAAGRPVYIVGRKASLYYFLADAPSAVPFTDLSTQCVTDRDNGDLIRALGRNEATYVFWAEESASETMKGGGGNPAYRTLGLHHGVYVFERKDLPPAAPPEWGGE